MQYALRKRYLQLVVMYQNTHNEEHLQEILRRNKGLIHQWAFEYRNIPYNDIEDIEAEGSVALWKAVENFDNQIGVKFTSCLKGYVKQAYNRLYNEATRKKRYDGVDPVVDHTLSRADKKRLDKIAELLDPMNKDGG